MSDQKKNPCLKRILLGLLAIVLTSAAVYWYVATEKFADTKDRKESFTVNAQNFIQEFTQNDSLSNKKYSDQIVVVNGTVSAIETADSTLNIKMIDTTSGSYIIFAFQEQYQAEAKTVNKGDIVSIKGSCSGSIYSDILNSVSITFKRCTLNKQK
jgi:hypothetical protein